MGAVTFEIVKKYQGEQFEVGGEEKYVAQNETK